MKTHTLRVGAIALACLLAMTSSVMAQTVAAPGGSYVPTNGIAWGAKGSQAQFVDNDHRFPVDIGTWPNLTFTNTTFGATQSGTWNVNATDSANAAFQGVVPMTVGTSYTAGRSIALNCTVAGNVNLTFADDSTYAVPVQVGFQTMPFAVKSVLSSGTTATCTYANLK